MATSYVAENAISVEKIGRRLFDSCHSSVTVTGSHVRTCRCTPPLVCVKLIANESLTTHRISAQYVQPFPRYESGGLICTRARAHVKTYPTHDLCDMHQ